MSLPSPRSGEDALAPFSDRSRPVEIIPKLYIGNLRASKNLASLEELGVTHILTVASDIEPEFPKRFRYKVVSVDDSNEDDLAKHFERAFRFIDKGRRHGGVLVHCHAGFSRSPSITIGYLMSRQQLSFEEAYNYIKSKDSLIEPNEGFVEQLKQLEKRLIQSRTPPPESETSK